MKGFMAVVFKIGLVRKNEFTNYWSNQTKHNILWFSMMFSRDHFRKILRAFHIVDKNIIPARDDPSYRPSIRLRLLLDYLNSLIYVYTISFLGSSSHNQWKFGCCWKVCNSIFDNTFQINTLQGLEQKSVWLLTVILPNYVLQCCYVFEGAKYDPSSKNTGPGYDLVIGLMKMLKCFDKRHHLFTDKLFITYAF